MSDAPKSRPAKRRTNRKAASEALFDPAVFLETTAKDRVIKISQETLAEMIGTTRSRVSHFMNKFRQLGFINYNGHLEVHNSLVGVLLGDQPRTVSAPKDSLSQ